MKLVLLLSFLKLSLAFNISGSSVISHHLAIQHPSAGVFVSNENPRRKPIASTVVVPGSVAIDAARANRHVDSSVKRHRKLRRHLCVSSKCQNIKSRAEMKTTDYIGLRDENELAGPEGKIAEALARSINTSLLLVNGAQPFELILNLAPIRDHVGAWSLVYHPYRKVPLVPVIRRAVGGKETEVTFCLLTMLTIMIIMLLHVMGNLIRINDFECNDGFELSKRVVVPRSLMSAVEKFFYLCLSVTFFVDLGVILEIVFLAKYGRGGGAHEMKIRSVDDLARLDLTPLFSTEQCLRELVINESKRHYCVVDEDFGREVIRRYYGSKDRAIQLVEAVELGFEWRGVHLDGEDRYLERFNRVQTKLAQSGLLDKWYRDEMIVNFGKEGAEMMRMRGDRSARRRDESERLRKFVYFLVMVVANGAVLAFFMFVAECVMQCGAGVKDREICYQWN